MTETSASVPGPSAKEGGLPTPAPASPAWPSPPCTARRWPGPRARGRSMRRRVKAAGMGIHRPGDQSAGRAAIGRRPSPSDAAPERFADAHRERAPGARDLGPRAPGRPTRGSCTRSSGATSAGVSPAPQVDQLASSAPGSGPPPAARARATRRARQRRRQASVQAGSARRSPGQLRGSAHVAASWVERAVHPAALRLGDAARLMDGRVLLHVEVQLGRGGHRREHRALRP